MVTQKRNYKKCGGIGYEKKQHLMEKDRFCINWIEYVLKKAIFICSFHFFCIIIVRKKAEVEYETKI